MNKAFITGYIGNDAKISAQTDTFTASTFSVATKDREKKAGQWVDTTDWHNMKMFNRANLIPYLTKGALVSIIGKIKMDTYTDKEGATKHYHYIEVDEIELLSTASQQKGKPSEGSDPNKYDPSVDF